jgi:hypothetical protein
VLHIEAVTVCVGYDDFLSEAAKYNIPLFDRWLIITEPEDKATRLLCHKLNLHCFTSNDGKRKGGFAKGRLVERGLQHLSTDGWRLHIDADMVLPRRFRNLLDSAELEEDHIYGIDRAMCRDWNQWQKVQQSGYLQGGHDGKHSYINAPAGLWIGSRWSSPSTGYCPIGAFQLWHSSQDQWNGIRSKPYPEKHNEACRTDIQHALQWDRNKRSIIPEVIAIHLESEATPLGTNWLGRKTKRFGPPDNCTPCRPYC